MKDVWNRVLSNIGEKISQKAFDIWLKPLRPVRQSENLLELEVPNKFFKDWISENYQTLIKDSLFHITNTHFAIQFRLREEEEEKKKNRDLWKKFLFPAPARRH